MFRGMSPDRRGEFLDLLYATAVDSAAWDQVLEQFADIIGGDNGWLSRINPSHPIKYEPASWPDPVARERTLESRERTLEYCGAEHSSNRIWPPEKLVDPIAEVREDGAWSTAADWVRPEFHDNSVHLIETQSILVVPLWSRADRQVYGIHVSRSKRRGGFAKADIEHAADLRPHLVRAFELSQKISVGHGLSGDLAAALDLTSHGVFVLDRDRRIRHANRAAQSLAANCAELTVVRGRLSAAGIAAGNRLQALVRAASAADRAGRVGGSMLIGSVNRRLAVTVTPMRGEELLAFQNTPSVIVCVCDPEAGVSLPGDRLQMLFGLTPAEARVALALFDGHSPREVSKRLGVSFHTIRNQLQQIYRKTDVSRQSALISLLARAVGLPIG